MPLKAADHHTAPLHTVWIDGRDGVLFYMEDAEVERRDPIRCFIVREALDDLATANQTIDETFGSLRKFIEAVASRLYDDGGRPIEIVITRENYASIRAKVTVL